MEYIQKTYISIDKYKVIQYFISFFFLNRIISMNIFGNSVLWDEVYVLISEIITMWYVFKCVCFYSKKKTLYLREISCIATVIMYFVLLLLITFVNDGNIRRIFMVAYPIMGTLCFIDMASRKYSNELLTALYYFFEVMLICNFADMIFVKKVLFTGAKEFLIGGRNQMAIILAIAVSCAFAYYENNKENMSFLSKILNSMVHLLVIMTAAFAGSATTIIGVAIVYILSFSILVKRKKILFEPMVFLVIYGITWLALIVFRLQYLFADLIINILHKDLTLSHRTIIWDKALEMISRKPLFGYGMSDSVNVFSVNHDYTGGNNDVLTTLSGHNEILQILYYGGISLLAVFMILYSICCSRRRRKNDKFFLFFFSVIAIFVVWLSEVPSEYAMFFVLGLCYYSERFEKKKLIKYISV